MPGRCARVVADARATPRRPASPRVSRRRRRRPSRSSPGRPDGGRSARGCATCARRRRRRRAGRPRLGADPARTARRPACASSRSPPRAMRHGRSPTTATRRTSWPSPAADGPRRASRTCPTDNALPRWLAEHAGYRGRGPAAALAPRRRHRRPARPRAARRPLGESASPRTSAPSSSRGSTALARRRPPIRAPSCSSPAGRRSTPLAWLERDRGRTDARAHRGARPAHGEPGQRPAGRVDRSARCSTATGRSRSATTLARLGEAAIVDTRVLLAHRLGADERDWPAAEDRFASDLLLPERIADPWLRDLTRVRRRRPDPGRPRRPHARRARAAAGPRRHMERAPGPLRPASAARPPDLDGRRRGRRRSSRGSATRSAATGPMPFARFMELALYDPERRLLPRRRGSSRPGRRLPDRAGDCTRSSGPTLAPACATTSGSGWAGRTRSSSASTGPATGALAAGHPATARTTSGARRRHPLRAGRGRPAPARRVRVHAGGGGARRVARRRRRRRRSPGVVLANEVLDALPVASGRRSAVTSCARSRSTSDPTAPSSRSRSSRRRRPSLPVSPPRASSSPTASRPRSASGVDAWVAAATAAASSAASLLLIDYGYPGGRALRPGPARDGTLRAYVRHQVHDDPYRAVGRQDLTAHVDVDRGRAGRRRAPGSTHLGIDDPGRVPDRARDRGAAAGDPGRPGDDVGGLPRCRGRRSMRMLDPAAMGRFRVMAFGRDWPDGPGTRLPAPATARPVGYRRPGGTVATVANVIHPD